MYSKELTHDNSLGSYAIHSLAIAQNHPNPFNPETGIQFQLPEASHVVVRIFNTLGQEIRSLTDREYEAGFHSVRWDAKDNNGNVVSSGIYFYHPQAGKKYPSFVRYKFNKLINLV